MWLICSGGWAFIALTMARVGLPGAGSAGVLSGCLLLMAAVWHLCDLP